MNIVADQLSSKASTIVFYVRYSSYAWVLFDGYEGIF